MSVAEFLKGLPSYNENNFTKFHVDSSTRSPLKRPSVYIPTKDYPSEQKYTKEKRPWVSRTRRSKPIEKKAKNRRK